MNRIQFARHPSVRQLQRGVSLIELMVAMTIGLVLIYGASAVYLKSRNTYSDNDAIARLQESARYALNAIEQDVRMSSYWGLYSAQLKAAASISGQANQLTDGPLYGTAVNYCGKNLAADLKQFIQGDNNGFLPDSQGGIAGFLSASRNTSNCPPLNDKAVTTADTLTVRRASDSRPTSATPGKLQICSTISHSATLTDDSSALACPNDGISGLIADLLVHSYYVDQDSDQQTGLPSLRQKILTTNGSAPVFQDQEVITGIEDMQVQFGIETSTNASDPDFSGIPSRYVNPNDIALNPNNPAAPAAAQVVTVRVWLLIRGETPETNFTDAKTYEYGDRLIANGTTGDLDSTAGAGKAYQPSASTNTNLQRYRRLLVSRTFQVRNANNN